MSYRRIGLLGMVLACTCAGTGLQGQTPFHRLAASPILAATPPMGWNSWDSYGTTVDETQVKANADWMAAHLKQHGWQYIVVDMEWFVSNPIAEGNATNFKYSLDATTALLLTQCCDRLGPFRISRVLKPSTD